MSANFERSADSTEAITLLESADLASSATNEPTINSTAHAGTPPNESPIASPDETTTAVERVVTLAELPPGARLILCCRKDWRAASVSSVGPDCIRLNVASPSGHTYRVRRPHDSVLTFDGSIPVLCERDSMSWRVALVRYDARW